jgi:oligopeptide/dipeptide ABC transporter ATP-binding protein
MLAIGKREGIGMEALLKFQEVFKYFSISSSGMFQKRVRMLKAVDGVSFFINKGTSFALAGESGSGKTTVSRLILLLENLTRGSILFEGKNLQNFTKQDLKWYRTRVQAVFQDAAGSLDPRMRIKDIVGEPMIVRNNNTLSRKSIEARTEEILGLVGLRPAVMHNYPHELSGGQKQRVAIARAMILDPSLVILDEPVSSLDVSVRAQILNLLADLQEKLGLTYFLIAHDLATLGHVSTQIGIMYLGRIVEIGDTEKVYGEPLHPYTKALFLAMPQPDPGRRRKRASLSGEIGSALDLPRGCRFHPRCSYATSECREAEPLLADVSPNHQVACNKIDA